MADFQNRINLETSFFYLEVKRRSDRLMNYFLPIYFAIGLSIGIYLGNWVIAMVIGGTSILTYYTVKFFLPNSSLYQYVLSAVLGVLMAQFIYQLPNLYEMYFFAFIGSAILVTYQRWKLQIPMLIVVIIHYTVLNYLQNGDIYHFDLHFIMHISLTTTIFIICGLWSYQLNMFYELHINQTLQLIDLTKEAHLSIERKENAEKLKAVNTSLELKAKELARSNAALEQFAYVASHDLQEPLRTITSFLKQLEQKYKNKLDENAKQYIHFATDGAQRLKLIIQDLLEFSKAGKKEDKREELNLQELVGGITELYKNQINEQQANIIFNNLPIIKGYKTPIRQVFQNLIDNALKYQRANEIPQVSIEFQEMEKHWQFSVIDNGIGISKEYLEEIFIIFKRLHSNAVYPGTGIGLAITKKIVEFLGGEIWVESKEGEGAAFHFSILKV